MGPLRTLCRDRIEWEISNWLRWSLGSVEWIVGEPMKMPFGNLGFLQAPRRQPSQIFLEVQDLSHINPKP